MKSKLLVLLAAVLALPLLTACESEEDRTLAEAEACINSATSTNVDACMAKVDGLTSEDAYLIRCSAHFIAQNITETRLASAFTNIKSSSAVAGVTPTTIALSYMIFDETKLAHNVAVSKSDCELSGAPSLSRIVSLAEIATTFAAAAGAANSGFTPGDTASVESFIANFVANSPGTVAQDETTIGNLAVGIRENFCVNNSPFTGTDVCTKMNQAFTSGVGNPQTIGQQIIALLQ